MKITRMMFAPLLATTFVLAGAACRNTAEGVKKDAAESAEKAKEAAAEAAQKAAEAASDAAAGAAQKATEAGQAVAQGAKEMTQSAAEVAAGAAQSAKEAGQAVAQGAKEATQKAADATAAAGQKAAEASKSAGAAVAAASNTFDVKASLLADSSIDAANINVDTDAKTRTVILKGSVPTDQQKSAAERLAASKATGYKVVNQLVVAPKK